MVRQSLKRAGMSWRVRSTATLSALLLQRATAQLSKANGTILNKKPLRRTASYDEWFACAYDPAHADPMDPTADLQKAHAY